jgi:glycosyltransferase involved in cell wall biosynthesis
LCTQEKLMKDGSLRIGIVHPYDNLDTVPSICFAIELLANAGYQVDVFTPLSPDYPTPTFESNNIVVIPHNIPHWEYENLNKDIDRWPTAWRIFINHLVKPYVCFIGVDPKGLIRASELSGLIRVPQVYFSLELLLSEEVENEFYKKIKQRELSLSRRAAFIIIQDEARKALLSRDNGIKEDKFILVPNSPIGPARKQKAHYWQDKFKLKAEQRVVLYAGSIDKWAGLENIVESSFNWPNDWVLIIHSRSESSQNELTQALKQKADPERVFFSMQPVPRESFDELIDSADIVIAIYITIPGDTYAQKNLTTIGLSSGKTTYALRSGLPVIINRGEGLPILIEQLGSGVIVNKFEEIGEAIHKIEKSYNAYSQAALKLFDDHLDFSTSFLAVIKRISKL